MKILKSKKFIIPVAVMLALVIAFGIYVGGYYRADAAAAEAFAAECTAEKRVFEDMTVHEPEYAEAGFVFYPGGLVEHTAYEPLMQECAEKGILCAVVKMPFNLAVFDTDAAEDVIEMYPQIEKWYIGGHSLGGSMAASYVSKNTDKVEGLILLAAYSTADLTESGIEVLSVKGSADKILNAENYEKYKSNLPADTNEVTVAGGNHSGFGMYGHQKGDGESMLGEGEQIRLAADQIAKLIFE